MRIKFEIELDRPDAAKEGMGIIQSKLICTGNNRGEKIEARVMPNSDVLFTGRSDVGPQRMKMSEVVETCLRAYAQAK